MPHTTVYITAEISNVNYAYLAYRFKFSEKFNKIQMYDDGNNGDGIAGDGIYGASINVDVGIYNIIFIQKIMMPVSFLLKEQKRNFIKCLLLGVLLQ